MSDLTVKTVDTAKEEAQLRELATQTFDFPDASWEDYLTIVAREDLRVAYVGPDMVGGMSYYPVRQWFGGQSVPMAGLALVLMAPEHRGQGYAFRMLAEVMRHLRSRGFALSTLYPSTMDFYRKLDFEQAGNSYDYFTALRDIGVNHQTLPMRRVDAEQQLSVLKAIAARHAQFTNGCIDRNEGMWRRIYLRRSGKVFCYLVGSSGKESGYLVYDQIRHAPRSATAHAQWEQRVLNVRDMVVLNADAMQSIWSFISGNRTVTDLVKWVGPATDPRNLLTKEFEVKVFRARRWMLRLLNVEQALLQRGYPKLDAELTFDVDDTLIPENQGTITLRLHQGRPEVSQSSTSEGAIRVSVGSLAPLYSGLFTAEQLQAAGMLVCSDQQSVATASRVFASSEPWMVDSF